MKKFLLAALLSSIGVVASAQVAVTGKLSTWVDNTKVGSASATGMVIDPTSNVAISANEKLGGGLAARAVVETSLSGNAINGVGTQLGDRQRTVGLTSAMGSVDLGRNVHSQFAAIAGTDPFAVLYGSVAGDVHNLRGLRLDNAVFVSVTPIKGVTANYERSEIANRAEVFAASASVAGVNGSVSQFRQGAEKSTVIAANYGFGPAKVSYSHSDNRGMLASKGDLIGASMNLGQITAKASYGRTNTDVRAYNLGVDYAFSKRTEAGVVYRNVNRYGTVADVRQLGVGVTHRF